MQVTLRRQQLRMARELADRFEVGATAHQRRQEVMSERAEAARRRRVPPLDLLKRAQDGLPRGRVAIGVQDDAGRWELPAHRLRQHLGQRGANRDYPFIPDLGATGWFSESTQRTVMRTAKRSTRDSIHVGQRTGLRGHRRARRLRPRSVPRRTSGDGFRVAVALFSMPAT